MGWFDMHHQSITERASKPEVTIVCLMPIVLAAVIGEIRQTQAAELTFGAPRPLTEVNDPNHGDFSPSLSPDGLELYFMGYQRPGSSSSDLYVAGRDSTSNLFGPPQKLEPPLATVGADSNPEISADGLTLFFDSSRSGTKGERDIWTASRVSIDDPWGSPINLGAPVNGLGYDGRPTVSGDGLILVFDRYHNRMGTLFMATRANKDVVFETPQDLGILGASPSISADGLTLFFMRLSSNPLDSDIYVATRATRQEAFGTPTRLGPEINSNMSEADPDISFDGSTLHFVRSDLFRIPGSPEASFLQYADLWEAAVISKLPGDHNNDGLVDAADYVVWRKGLGTTYTHQDYDVWRANFGNTAGSGLALPSVQPLSAAIPEPASPCVVVVLFMPLSFSRARRRTLALRENRQVRCFTICGRRETEISLCGVNSQYTGFVPSLRSPSP